MLTKIRPSLILVTLLLTLAVACTPKATKYLNKGKAQFNQAEYQFAIENFQQALSYGTPSGEANYLIAESYRRSNRIHESEKHYQKAVEAKVTDEEAYFYYAFALKSNGNYEGAASQFQNYIKLGTNFDFINRSKNELQNIKILSEIANKKSLYKITNIEDLNTDAAEYSPFVYDQVLYFTSSRGVDKMHAATGTGFTEIYKYIFDGANRFSGQAQKLPDGAINTLDAHEANAIITKDGNTMLFARGNDGSKKGQQDVDLFQSIRQPDGTWGIATILPISNPDAWDACPALSPDEKTLYFASNREGGNGGVDIYKATKNPEGNWDAVENIGSPVNTRGNDMFPYETKEGVFHFSSDGHPSIGALDFFIVKKEGNVLKIENMGSGINTSYDELGLFYTDSMTGYFASNRPNGKGDDDIYEFVDESKIKTAHYVLDGTVFEDSLGKKTSILPGSLVVILNERGDTVKSMIADEFGQFKADLEPETKYTIIASKQPGYLTEEIEVFIPKVSYKDLKPGDNEIKHQVKIILPLKAMNVEFAIDNIYYDYDKWDIRPDAAIELYKVVEFMKLNPDVSIELGSHTDARGSSTYNRNLAQKRAQSAVNFIVSKSIDKGRIVAKGYGEDKLVIKDAKTEEEHQQNRRTTVRITGIDEDKLKIINKGEERERELLNKQ
jgi:peptidoglycan-associated lipoprotein